MIQVDRRSLLSFDYLLLSCLALLLAFGVVLVASAGADGTADLYKRQVVWALVALSLAVVVPAVDYRQLTDRGYLFWSLFLALLTILLVFGPERAGVTSWFSFGSLSLQPSEFAKIVVIIALARYFSERDPRPFGIGGLAMPGLLVGVPFVLTALQPDLGTATTLLPIFAGLAWIAGVRWQAATKLAACGVALAPIGFFFLKEYQRARILSFVNPEADPLGAGYQVVQSKIAIGSGGLLGKGLFVGSQSQLQFLPAQHTDLIFAVLGEELGFLGVALALILYSVLLRRIFQTARLARDRVGSFVATGVGMLLLYHLMINVGMVVGLAPITGIPLPLLSYGGSSALATGVAIGLVQSVRVRRFIN